MRCNEGVGVPVPSSQSFIRCLSLRPDGKFDQEILVLLALRCHEPFELGGRHGRGFDAQFENKAAAVETVTPMREKDGSWRVSGYFIK